jgi:acetyl-CoA acetyltransferase
MRKVGIVGVGQLPFKSRYAEKSFLALALEATKKALDDAKISKEDVDEVVYSIYCELMLRQQIPEVLVQEYLGMHGKPSIRLASGAATGLYSLYAAFAQVASGLADIVLLVGTQKGGDFYDFKTRTRGDGWINAMGLSLDVTWLQPVAVHPPHYLTASLLEPHINKFGGPTEEQLAKVSVKNHKNALVNPNAQLKVDLSVEDVMYSRIIAWPTTLYECCLMSDGAAALVLASEDKAKEISDNPIWISGIMTSTYNTNMLKEDSLGRIPGINTAAGKAYDMAGIKDPKTELDVAEVHDLISGLEIMMYEELGFCELGKGGTLIDDGTVEKSGSLPVNPSGGRVACGHVASVSGVSSTGDVVRQLRETAGGIQVPIRSGKGLVESNCGNAQLCAVAILERSN